MNASLRQLMMAATALALPASINHALAQAQTYPTRAIRVIVPFPPGGNVDFAARLLSPKLSEALGKQVVVENRPGASGIIGNAYVAKSPKDGYTLLVNGLSVVTAPALYSDANYDPIRDFDAISLLSVAPTCLVVHPSLPVRSVRELLALARANPGQLNFGSAGSGTITHLSGELFKTLAKVNITHVPYKGSAPAVTDLVGGQLQLIFANMPAVSQFVTAGRLRMVAVSGRRRFAGAPDVPTMAEAGVPGYEAYGWNGFFAPANTPKPVVDRLAGETAKVLGTPAMKEFLANEGAEPGNQTQPEFAAFVKSEVTKWRGVLARSGVKVE